MNKEFALKITKNKHPRTVILPYGAGKIQFNEVIS